jgi:hypothetical protein
MKILAGLCAIAVIVMGAFLIWGILDLIKAPQSMLILYWAYITGIVVTWILKTASELE